MKYRVPQGQPCLEVPIRNKCGPALYTSSDAENRSKDNEMKENPSAWQGAGGTRRLARLMRVSGMVGGQGLSGVPPETGTGWVQMILPTQIRSVRFNFRNFFFLTAGNREGLFLVNLKW